MLILIGEWSMSCFYLPIESVRYQNPPKAPELKGRPNTCEEYLLVNAYLYVFILKTDLSRFNSLIVMLEVAPPLV